MERIIRSKMELRCGCTLYLYTDTTMELIRDGFCKQNADLFGGCEAPTEAKTVCVRSQNAIKA